MTLPSSNGARPCEPYYLLISLLCAPVALGPCVFAGPRSTPGGWPTPLARRARVPAGGHRRRSRVRALERTTTEIETGDALSGIRGAYGARRANVLSLSRTRPSPSGSATRSVAQNEARKRRASERPRVGCCEELAGRSSVVSFACSEPVRWRHATPRLFKLLLLLLLGELSPPPF